MVNCNTLPVNIKANLIGTTANGASALANTEGINVGSTVSNTTIGGINAGEGNTIAFNTTGININGNVAIDNQILGNSIYANNTNGILLSAGGNGNKLVPIITSATTSVISGTCQAGDTIEVFGDSPQTGTTNQGRIYLGTVTTFMATTWTLNAAGLPFPAGRVTATATDATNGTSSFSNAMIVTIPTYYSRVTTGNWGDPNTWSTTSHTGTASTNTPSSGDIAIIGNTHTVIVMNSDDIPPFIDIQVLNGATLQYNQTPASIPFTTFQTGSTAIYADAGFTQDILPDDYYHLILSTYVK